MPDCWSTLRRQAGLILSPVHAPTARIARNPPRVLHWKAPNVERRIMKVATIQWDFPQGHGDERSARRWDKIAGH